ncbi:saccharopine dehydrogenase [Exophiala viscosa]|uniref:Saccharopine dehydrogenase n=1 Tax=Exophiala viscosa TaxID=2486360 RepID=A0AAN6DNB5_9EURO|nr:saccharopine dehydrogenase [Exophiala viscosa]
MANTRQYDIVLLGATGYTGKLTAEYITSSLPTNIKWAVAGRNQSKLQSLVDELKSQNSTRSTPDIITVASLSTPEVSTLAKKTKVLLNTVGPYHQYSTPVVEACAQTGTHYIDVTGETPWIRDIIVKYEATAKKTGAIIIPGNGVESAPSDLIAYIATRLIRKVWDCGVMDVVASVHELKSSGPSGGTLATGLGLMDHYSAGAMKECLQNPFILSPTQLKPYTKDTIYPRNPEPNTYIRTPWQKWTGVWSYPRLGHLTTSITAKPNMAIVHRSAGMTPYFYGFNFSYEEYMAVGSPLVGVLIHIALALLTLFLAFPPTRVIMKLLTTYKPGSGPSKESTKGDVFELRAIAVAEQLAKQPRKALATFRFEGGVYELTAILLAEAAVALLTKEEEIKKSHGAGFLTPSCLGNEYLERLEKANVKIGVRQIGDVGSK